MLDGICLGNLMIDCDDEEKLCMFYEKLLGWKRDILYGHPALCSNVGLVLLFMEDADYIPPVWPEEKDKQQKQMHFDFQVPDVSAAVAYAQTLGARKAPQQFGGTDFVTMLDPAGHPFCLCDKNNET